MGEIDALPDTMYSREVAIRLLRHAAWYVMALRLPIAAECVNLLALAQKQVLQMSTGDFYRIKVMGCVYYNAGAALLADGMPCPCACHVSGNSWCDRCAKFHKAEA